MAREPYPSELQDRFLLRMPEGLRDRIAAAAKRNGRSMNAEIVSVLEERYPAPEGAFDDIVEAIRKMADDPDKMDSLWEVFEAIRGEGPPTGDAPKKRA